MNWSDVRVSWQANEQLFPFLEDAVVDLGALSRFVQCRPLSLISFTCFSDLLLASLIGVLESTYSAIDKLHKLGLVLFCLMFDRGWAFLTQMSIPKLSSRFEIAYNDFIGFGSIHLSGVASPHVFKRHCRGHDGLA